jgi:sugar phosphate isomerase/epimerase
MFRSLSAAEIVEVVKQAGLEAIEWGGDVHVPPGDLDAAKEALRLTRDAGLEVSSYGSYYKIFNPDGTLQEFAPVLESALALETNVLRIIPGSIGPDADDAHWTAIAEHSRAAADAAAKHDVRVAFEFHPLTLTETHESTLKLLEMIDHPNMYMYWQPAYFAPSMEYRMEGLTALKDRILNLHVYHWNYERKEEGFYAGIDRRPLEEGRDDWAQYFAVELNPDLPHFALIEFVKGDTPDQLMQDAAALKSWLK